MISTRHLASIFALVSVLLLSGCGGSSCDAPETQARLIVSTGFATSITDNKPNYVSGFNGKVANAERVNKAGDRHTCKASVQITGSVKQHLDHQMTQLGGLFGASLFEASAKRNPTPESTVILEALYTLGRIHDEHAGELLTVSIPVQYTVSAEDGRFIEKLSGNDVTAQYQSLLKEASRVLDAQNSAEKSRRDEEAKKLGYKNFDHQMQLATQLETGRDKVRQAEAAILRLQNELELARSTLTTVEGELTHARANMSDLERQAADFERLYTTKTLLQDNPHIHARDLRFIEDKDRWSGSKSVHLQGVVKNITSSTLTEATIGGVFWSELLGVVESNPENRYTLKFGRDGLAPGDEVSFSVQVSGTSSRPRDVLYTPDYKNSKTRHAYLMVLSVKDGRNRTVPIMSFTPPVAYARAQALIAEAPQRIKEAQALLEAGEGRMSALRAELEQARAAYQSAMDEKSKIDAKRKAS